MTDVVSISPTAREGATAARLRRRHAAERRFRTYGAAAIAIATAMLAILLISIVTKGYSAFLQTDITLDIQFDLAVIDPAGDRDRTALAGADYGKLIKGALQARFPDVTSRQDKRRLNDLISSGAAFELRDLVLGDPAIIGTTRPVALTAADDIDMLNKGHIRRDVPETERQVSDQQIAWLDALAADGRVGRQFSRTFFTAGDSREPEQAGVWGAMVGSALTMLVTLVLSFPLGLATAIYLEEFAPRNRWTDLIEVTINNLAAVPSIVFGLLGLAVLLGFFGLPRSAPLVGGIVLALMTLPVVIIAGRAALNSVPPSIRAGALAIGASPLQVVLHHTMPLAMPGVLTGTIIGMARALGESAPLLMIGMVAFIVDIPRGLTDAATVLPVQIYLWADSPERAFVERTSAAIIVLLAVLMVMNAAAVLLRRKFERRW
ncbi:MAG: phosphate ABC transporter permease PstA [Dongiaceae bacterium]